MKTLLKYSIQYLLPPEDTFAEQDHEKEGGAAEVKTEVSNEQAKENFLAKFSARKSAPPELGGDPASDANKEVREHDETRKQQESEKRAAEAEENKRNLEERRPGSNVPKILESKRQAEKERDEFRAKVEDYENKVRPGLEAKIAELQNKIESGEYSSKKEQEFQSKITDLETRLHDEKESLVNENATLKKRLEFHDIQNSADFQQEYVKPVMDAHTEMVKALNEDPKYEPAFRRVLTANAMVLQATTPENRRQAVIERNNAIQALTEDLDDYSASQFRDSMRDYIYQAERHQKAIIESDKTVQEIKAKAKEAGERAYADHLNSWTAAFKAKTDFYKEDEEMDESIKDSIKDLGIDIDEDIKRHNILARKTIAGETDIQEAIDIVHKGRVYPVLKAKISALQKQVKDKDAIISKLRSAGTDGGTESSSGEGKKADSREEFYNKFRPGKQS